MRCCVVFFMGNSFSDLEDMLIPTSRLAAIHQFLNTSVFSEERPSRDDEQDNYVVLAKAADLPRTLDSA